MSEDEKSKVIKDSNRSKWASIITAVLVLVRTIVDIVFN